MIGGVRASGVPAADSIGAAMVEQLRSPALTVDCICFDPEGRVLLVRRRNPPFQNAYALPGGFVDAGETVETACRRELAEETGLEAGALRLVGVYSEPARDPRGHTVSVVYLTQIAPDTPTAGSDAAAAAWISDWEALELAFDHAAILGDAKQLLSQI